MINPMDLSGRVVLVTGASSGIGRETAILLSQLGARLVLVARNVERLGDTAARLDGEGHNVEPFDLAQTDELPRWLKDVTARTGPLSGLVHSAGIHLSRPLRLTNDRDIDQLMHVNVNAALGLAKSFRQKGVYTPPARIVFLSSVMGIVGQPGVAVYAASKGAVTSLTKSLAMELARESITVNCVAPAQVQTEMVERLQDTLTTDQLWAIEAMHPLGIGTALDVAHAVAFLLAETGRWITGTTLVVDGGYTAH